MKKTLALGIVMSAALLASCSQSSFKDNLDTAELPVSRVVMYQNGVGYMERLGRLSGDELVLRVRTDQINDILKSMTVIDRGTGRPISISLPVDPRTLSSLSQIPDQISYGGGIYQLLDAFRGAHVRVKAKKVYEGRIVGLEDTQPVQTESGLARQTVVTLANENKLEVINVNDIKSVELYDRSLSVGLDKSLDMSLSDGDWKPVEFRVRMSNSSTRDVQLSYIVSMPTWKPAYRLILDDSDEALLQGWAVISNVSGSDWNNISFSLVSGQPMSFTYDLYRPHFLKRTDLSGQMRNTAIAPKIQQSGYAKAEAEYPKAAPSRAALEDNYAAGSYGLLGASKADSALAAPTSEGKSSRSKKSASSKSAGSMMGRARTQAMDWKTLDLADEDFEEEFEAEPPEEAINYEITNEDFAKSFEAAAVTEQVGALFEYKLDGKLTVPDGSSALVNLIQNRIPTTETRMFEPQGGLQSQSFHNVQIKNSTQYDLEPGPITIYKNGSFIGEGFLSKTAPGAIAQVTFAAESRITLKRTENETAGASSIRQIRNGYITADVERIRNYEYELTNNATEKLTAGVRISRDSYWSPIDFPEGTITAANDYTVPIPVDASSNKKVTLSMKAVNARNLYLEYEDGYQAIASALKSQDFEPEIKKSLEDYVSIYETRRKILDEEQAIDKRKRELQREESEISYSISELKDLNTASGKQLKEQLTKRMNMIEKELAEITTKKAELHINKLEADVKFKEAVRTLSFEKK